MLLTIRALNLNDNCKPTNMLIQKIVCIQEYYRSLHFIIFVNNLHKSNTYKIHSTIELLLLKNILFYSLY